MLCTIYPSMDISVWQNGAMQLSVGAAIRERREAQGWSQAELAQRAGVNPETVNRAEHGSNVTVDKLLQITRALGAELELTLRPPGEEPQTVRDVLSRVTPPVSPLSHTGAAPGEDSLAVLPPSFPMSPAHVVLYAFVAKLSVDQADRLTRPLLDLIGRTTTSDDSAKPPKKTGK